MKQPEEVVAGVAGRLKPGGRFVGEFGGKGNVEKIRAAARRLRQRGIDPWALTRGTTLRQMNIRNCSKATACAWNILN
jgi:hypothetical protein